MYNSLTGTVTALSEASCGIDVAGVEYSLTITFGAREILKEGSRVRILVYLHHKEDQMRLFGFATEEERNLFIRLMKVSGVGPGLAIKILSGMNSDRLAAAIEKGDVPLLSGIPGLGKKTAQKIILALQGTLVRSAGNASILPHAEIITALSEMGFDRVSAAAAVKEVSSKMPAEISDDEAEERILRESIVNLSRNSGG